MKLSRPLFFDDQAPIRVDRITRPTTRADVNPKLGVSWNMNVDLAWRVPLGIWPGCELDHASL